MMETDPRENEATVNWNMMSAGFISAKDLELIWCLIKKEVRVSISDLLSDGLRSSYKWRSRLLRILALSIV